MDPHENTQGINGQIFGSPKTTPDTKESPQNRNSAIKAVERQLITQDYQIELKLKIWWMSLLLSKRERERERERDVN